MTELKKIVVIGPESTGKSTLCALLAVHYNTLWCPEYAREYLLTHGVTYRYDDLLTIAKGQLALEDSYVVKSEEDGEMSFRDGSGVKSEKDGRETGDVKRETEVDGNSSSQTTAPLTTNYKLSQSDPSGQTTNLLFIDTDMYVMKVWCEYVYGKCHDFINEQIATRHYDLYLLCDIDLPWEEDVLREYPDMERRQELYGIYKNLLNNQQTPWVEINGSYDERLEKAIRAVDSLLAE